MKPVMQLKFILTIALILGVCAGAKAVTDAEMEQARAITAKNYLRWVNNGSGYLDDIKTLPKSVEELKKSLHEKEKENLKKFEAVAVAKDYASWDKDRLVKYWSETFLESPGLDPVGKGSKSRTVKHLKSMTVTPPTEKPAEKPEEPTLEQTAADEATAQPADAVADEIAAGMADGAAFDSTLAEPEPAPAEDLDAVRPKKSNATWIYVGILVLLVIVVIVLVIYAARAMKGNNAEAKDSSDEIGGGEKKDTADEAPAYVPTDTVSRKEHEFMIERKNEKIRKVKAELDVVREENARLQASVDSLQNRLSQAQTQLESLRLSKAEAESRQEDTVTEAVAPRKNVTMRSLYLGRVNKNGLFVRADRQLNPEGTVYRLETEDGYTGSFRVVNAPEVVDRSLENPAHWLDGGCIVDSTVPADDASEIITESSGTAVLENGCWKMIRKAKVRLL